MRTLCLRQEAPVKRYVLFVLLPQRKCGSSFGEFKSEIKSVAHVDRRANLAVEQLVHHFEGIAAAQIHASGNDMNLFILGEDANVAIANGLR